MRIKTVEVIKKFEKEISEINKDGIHYSMLLYSATKKFFVAINKLDTQELSEYLQGINKENINAKGFNADIVNCLVALIIAEYTRTNFLRNFLNEYTQVKPNSRSEWKIVQLLQLIADLFKSEKIEIDSAKDNGLAEAFDRVSKELKTVKRTKDINKHISVVKDFSADLAVITQKIFLIGQQPQQTSAMKQAHEVQSHIVDYSLLVEVVTDNVHKSSVETGENASPTISIAPGNVVPPPPPLPQFFSGVSAGNNNTSIAPGNVVPPPPPLPQFFLGVSAGNNNTSIAPGNVVPPPPPLPQFFSGVSAGNNNTSIAPGNVVPPPLSPPSTQEIAEKDKKIAEKTAANDGVRISDNNLHFTNELTESFKKRKDKNIDVEKIIEQQKSKNKKDLSKTPASDEHKQIGESAKSKLTEKIQSLRPSVAPSDSESEDEASKAEWSEEDEASKAEWSEEDEASKAECNKNNKVSSTGFPGYYKYNEALQTNFAATSLLNLVNGHLYTPEDSFSGYKSFRRASESNSENTNESKQSSVAANANIPPTVITR